MIGRQSNPEGVELNDARCIFLKYDPFRGFTCLRFKSGRFLSDLPAFPEQQQNHHRRSGAQGNISRQAKPGRDITGDHT